MDKYNWPGPSQGEQSHASYFRGRGRGFSPGGSQGEQSHSSHFRGRGGMGEFSRKYNRPRKKPWRDDEDITNNFKQRMRNKPRRKYDRSAASDSSGNQDESSQREGKERPPPHLRGREIGLFYARRNRERAEREGRVRPRYIKPLATIFLPPATKDRIRSVLNSPSLKSLVDESTSYENIGDSSFKRAFLTNISGTLNDRLLPFSLDTEQVPSRDQLFYDAFVTKQETDRAYQEWQIKRQKLPAYSMKDEILKLIDSNQVVVISGETGCGKTTQVPQFILDDYLLKKQGSICRIVCTQPRRISAITVAERVAQERNEPLGITSGYSIRLERQPPRDCGSIIFCTAGIVLRQLVNDPSMKGVSHLILDEIHERDITCDFLICIIKQVIEIRRDLKVILMSATLNAESFSTYYNNAPHINIPGFTFPVEEYYLEDVFERLNFRSDLLALLKIVREEAAEYSEKMIPFVTELEKSGKYSRNTLTCLRDPACERLNKDLIFELLRDICQKEENKGAILVFLPGFMDISSLIKSLEQSPDFTPDRYVIFPLHSQMPTVNQKEIFLPPPANKRKIIVATNIAETSITIDDVVYVIDGGRIKMTNYDPETDIQTLKAEWVSLANASQRKGRAGRVQPGKCFHLYSRGRKEFLEPYQKPEILRTRLDDTILKAKLLQVGQIRPFFAKLLDPPDDASVTASLTLLRRLEAIDENENLTPLGYHLAKLPLRPQIGKMLLFGAMFSCLDPILSIATAMDFKDPFLLPIGKEKLVDRKRRELAGDVKSDHYIIHKVLEEFEKSNRKGAFCNEYFLSYQTVVMLKKLKKDYMEHLCEMEYVPSRDPKHSACNANSDNVSLIKAIVCAGLYPNVITARQTKRFISMKLVGGQSVSPHPKSLFSNMNGPTVYLDSPLLIYHMRLKSARDTIHDATMVYPLSVIFFGDQFQEETIKGGWKAISIGGQLKFKCYDETTLLLIQDLRKKLDLFLQYKISHPGVIDWRRKNSAEVMLLEAIQDMIITEELGEIDWEASANYEAEENEVKNEAQNDEIDEDPFEEELPEDIDEILSLLESRV